MKSTHIALGSLLAVGMTVTGCAHGRQDRPANSHRTATESRGQIVSTRQLQNLSTPEIRSALRKDSFGTSQVRFGVKGYQLVYRTIGADGRPTTASGLLVLPDSSQHVLQAIAYSHGTQSARYEAPSTDTGGRSDEGLALASAGYAAILPDYLGLGTGPGAHPYLQLASEVSAERDLLSAADTLTTRLHHKLDRSLLVTGFSQGGPAALAFGKSLQSAPLNRFRLAAVAPISGPYALAARELPAAIDGRLDGTDSAFYLAYLTVAYNRLYHLYDRPAQVFAHPYERTVAPLYDGNHDERQIFPALPRNPTELFTTAWLNQLRNPSGRLRAALRANDSSCTGWHPARIHIFAAHGDEQVAIDNAYSCQQQLARQHVSAQLIDLGNLEHLPSGTHGLAAVVAWFEHIRPPTG